MEFIAPSESDPATWILVDVQVSSSSENLFEVVESIQSQVIVVDDESIEEKLPFQKKPPDEPDEPEPSKETELPVPSKHITDNEQRSEDECSSQLQKSVELIQQSLETLQSESRTNSTEIESIRSRLDRLLLKQKLAAKIDILCKSCGTEIASQSDIVSRDFRGQSGPAILIRRVSNVQCGPSIDRVLMTGIHKTAWEFCQGCGQKLGWRYLEAMNPDQKYKIGMSCIEAESVNQL